MSRSPRRRLSIATGATRKSTLRLKVSALGSQFGRLTARHPRSTGLGVIMCAVGVGIAASGPVAGAAAAVYALLGLWLWRARTVTARESAERAAAVEEISEIVAGLRAGLPIRKRSVVGLRNQMALVRSEAALRISERLGAPLADLLDRVERDLRAQQRLMGTVAAELAATRATIGLLAVLPLGGAGIGYAIGTDPVYQLFHTRLGAGCTAIALALQTVGFTSSWYLTNSVTKELGR